MNVTLFQAASALNANSRWQELISENLAASSVPGYKKQELTTQAIQAGLMPGVHGNSPNIPKSFVIPKVSASTNFLPGEMKFTGDKNDVAIDGQGFFEVQLPNGNLGYTRDGEFQVNSQGQLVTKEGYTVIGDGGPIQIDLKNPAPLSIAPSGEVSQGAEPRGKLKVTDFDKTELLKPMGGGFFLANDPTIKAQASTATLRQGYLEGSNVSVVAEMANMMTAMRTFEANQRVVQMQDDRLGKAISDLGNPS